MIAFDTNHLLCHVLDDDPKQCARFRFLVESAKSSSEQIQLFDLVLLEACWVLQSVLSDDRDGWSHILNNQLQDPVFSLDSSSRVWKALERYCRGRADFADYLILGQSEAIGAKLETFDKQLKKEM